MTRTLSQNAACLPYLRLLGRDVTTEEASEFPMARWGPRACRATGTESEFHQRAAEREYFGILAALESQLESTRYALGDRPTAVDTIHLGGLRAHINADPIPKLDDYPRVTAWDEQNADPWTGDGTLAAFPESTALATHVLELARDQYAPFVLGNASALASGRKAFEIESYGEPVSYLTRSYPEQSRELVKSRIRDRLDPDERRRVGEWLGSWELAGVFMP